MGPLPILFDLVITVTRPHIRGESPEGPIGADNKIRMPKSMESSVFQPSWPADWPASWIVQSATFRLSVR